MNNRILVTKQNTYSEYGVKVTHLVEWESLVNTINELLLSQRDDLTPEYINNVKQFIDTLDKQITQTNINIT